MGPADALFRTSIRIGVEITDQPTQRGQGQRRNGRGTLGFIGVQLAPLSSEPWKRRPIQRSNFRAGAKPDVRTALRNGQSGFRRHRSRQNAGSALPGTSPTLTRNGTTFSEPAPTAISAGGGETTRRASSGDNASVKETGCPVLLATASAASNSSPGEARTGSCGVRTTGPRTVASVSARPPYPATPPPP